MCFISINQLHLVIILELCDFKNMFNILDQKYSILNAGHLYQLLSNCQTVSTQKNEGVIEKYKPILNLDAKICMKKSKFAF